MIRKEIHISKIITRIIAMVVLFVSVKAYRRDWGPIIGSFRPGEMEMVNECNEENNNVCLEIPSKEICKERLSQQLIPWMPLPWWYFYCKWLVSPKKRSNIKLTSSTVHYFFKKTLEDLTMFRKWKRMQQNKNN